VQPERRGSNEARECGHDLPAMGVFRMNHPITVVLVEDHALTRTGMRTALETSGDVRVIAEASDGVSAEELILREAPNIAIVDIGLPGRDGIALTRAIKSAVPATHVIILTMNELDDEVLAAFSEGRPERIPADAARTRRTALDCRRRRQSRDRRTAAHFRRNRQELRPRHQCEALEFRSPPSCHQCHATRLHPLRRDRSWRDDRERIIGQLTVRGCLGERLLDAQVTGAGKPLRKAFSYH
jgi:CheY-like chemotaxis protein